MRTAPGIRREIDLEALVLAHKKLRSSRGA
jgi:hypothetical protein